MSSVSETIGNDGAGIPFALPDGRTFTARLIDQTRKSVIERAYQSRALRAVMEMKPLLTPGEYRDQLADLAKRKTAGEYSFVGLMPTLDTADGFLMLVRVAFGAQPDNGGDFQLLDEEDAVGMALAQPEELKTLMKQIMEESFRPNGRRAAAKP